MTLKMSPGLREALRAEWNVPVLLVQEGGELWWVRDCEINRSRFAGRVIAE